MLNFVGLTTVQVCDAEDQKGALLLGEHQYIINRAPRVEVIVVMHHPPEWIKDRQEAFRYLDSRARVQIFGHEHLQEIHRISNANDETRLVICSGAVTPEHAAAPYIYRYNILEFALGGDDAAPSLAITVYPRLWIPESTRFSSDTGCLGGRESATFTLPCPQFRLAAPEKPMADPGTAVSHSHVGTEGGEAFARLNYFFWRYLTWRDQLKVLVDTDALPTIPEPPGLQTIAHMALNRARAEGTLSHVWNRMMLFVPEAKREPNPFIDHH